LVPSLHSEKLNANISFANIPFHVNRELTEWKRPTLKDTPEAIGSLRAAGISAFGAGGANVHIILEEYEPQALIDSPHDETSEIFVLSAKNEDRLKEYSKRIINYLGKVDNTTSLSDIAYTSQLGREVMEERLAVIVSTKEELTHKLTQYLQGENDIENFFKSNRSTRDNDLGHLVEGNAGIQFIRSLIQQRELVRLAHLWAMGIEIDWQFLHTTSNEVNPSEYGKCKMPRRISLPTYPFEKRRCWIPVINKSAATANSLHPLLDHVFPALTNKKEAIFKKIISGSDPLVYDHQMQTQPLFPAVGYVEMAFASMNQLPGKPHCKLSEAVFISPLIVNDKKELNIRIEQINDQYHFNVESTQAGKAVLHAKAVLSPTLNEKTNLVVSLNDLQQKCPRQLDSSFLREEFQKRGIQYGPYYNTIQKILVGENEALGYLSLLGEANDSFILHPALLDGAFQTIIALILQRSSGEQLIVPFSISEVEVFHPLQGQVIAHVQASGEYQFNLSILDSNGVVYAKLKNIVYRPVKNTSNGFLYKPKWILDSVEKAEKIVEDTSRTILLISPKEATGIKGSLMAYYSRNAIIEIELGDQNKSISSQHYEINVSDPDAIAHCIQRIPDIHTVYFISSPSPVANPLDITTFDHNQEFGVYSLFRLVKALGASRHADRALTLKVITHDSHEVLAGEKIRPDHAGLLGLTKSISKEYHLWQVSCFDVCSADWFNLAQENERVFLEPLISEPPQRGGEIAIRSGKRYVRQLYPIDLAETGKENTAFREKGVYLIIGGTGGIGLELSYYLAENVNAKLVLTGRSELTEERKSKIFQIEKKGGEAFYVQADATSIDDMQEVISQTKSRFGRIDGVIHCAMELKSQTIEKLSEQAFRSVLAPKVKGTAVLFNLLNDEPLDFILFFSSVQSWLGNMGESGYASACTFEDAAALYANQLTTYPVQTINWGYWGSAGAGATEQIRKI
ncbi:MAG TPA: SDR family NAD(P)-dependent oxidoreductase, partial [Flavitalea sp.]|nr:SDR family NAD(P)-dependent oxidoreductase [Flavitalea sp.]